VNIVVVPPKEDPLHFFDRWRQQNWLQRHWDVIVALLRGLAIGAVVMFALIKVFGVL